MPSARMTLAGETVNHRTAAKHGGWLAPPSALTWADLGEDLGARFAVAVEKLERLMYVIGGSPPASYSPFTPPTHRYHPRCLWLVEQVEQTSCNRVNELGHPICGSPYFLEQDQRFYETAALGTGVGIPAPQVPIRSRSGDPVLQTIEAHGDRVRFPVGSVTRSPGLEAWDPCGHGFFGGDPGRIGQDGPIEIAGEPVKIYYKPPASIAPKVGGVTLHTSVTSPTAMTLVGDAWEATIPPQEHGTRVEWYLEALIDGVLCRDPLSGEYSYVAFAHFNPYANGLPEMMDAWRKGTDRYLFDATECIQPELINLCRYVLDGIGRLLRHSPKRPGAGVNTYACCLEIPIVWRWSGSNRWPLYVAGGKANGVEPLHNLDEDVLTPEVKRARASWRGYPRTYGDRGGWDSWAYPGPAHDASWLSPLPVVGGPATGSELRWWPPRDPPPTGRCRSWWNSGGRGLHSGDVIDPVHIEEIIAAVDYLIDNGLWVVVPIRKRPLQPAGPFVDSLECGQRHAWHSSFGHQYGVPCGDWTNGRCCWYHGELPDCVPWPEPDDWEDCWSANEKWSDIIELGQSQPAMHVWPHGTCQISEMTSVEYQDESCMT